MGDRFDLIKPSNRDIHPNIREQTARIIISIVFRDTYNNQSVI